MNIESISMEELFSEKMQNEAKIAILAKRNEEIMNTVRTLLWADKIYNIICGIVITDGVAFYSAGLSNIRQEIETQHVNPFEVAELVKQKIVSSTVLTFEMNSENIKPSFMFDPWADVKILLKSNIQN